MYTSPAAFSRRTPQRLGELEAALPPLLPSTSCWLRINGEWHEGYAHNLTLAWLYHYSGDWYYFFFFCINHVFFVFSNFSVFGHSSWSTSPTALWIGLQESGYICRSIRDCCTFMGVGQQLFRHTAKEAALFRKYFSSSYLWFFFKPLTAYLDSCQNLLFFLTFRVYDFRRGSWQIASLKKSTLSRHSNTPNEKCSNQLLSSKTSTNTFLHPRAPLNRRTPARHIIHHEYQYWSRNPRPERVVGLVSQNCWNL